MVFFVKMGLPILALGLGGGVILGSSKGEANTPLFKSTTTSLEERGAENTNKTNDYQVAVAIQENPVTLQVAQTPLEVPKDTSQLKPEKELVPDVDIEKEGTEGNCEVVIDFQAVMVALSLRDDSYVAVSCDNKGINGEIDETFEDKWTGKWIGLFPRYLFKEGGEKLIQGYKLDIQTNTEQQDDIDAEELYKTIFQSNLFSVGSQIVGKWDDGNVRYDDKFVDFVKIKGLEVQNNIYFVHTGED